MIPSKWLAINGGCLPISSPPPKSYYLTIKDENFLFLPHSKHGKFPFNNKTVKVRIRHNWWTFVEPLLEWKRNKYYILCVCVCVCVCICSLRYAACNAHAPYCYLWPAQLYDIFPHYLINVTIFEKKKRLLNIKCVFYFSLQLLSETFLILRRNERDMIKNVYYSACKVTVFFVRF